MTEKEKATIGGMVAGTTTGDGFNSIIPHEHSQKPLQNYAKTMQNYAVAYARLGWAVLPLFSIKNGHCACGRKDCHSPGKHPQILDGVKGAQKDPFNVEVWFDPDPMIGYPDANIGVACGKASGFFVLDIDGPEGEQSLQALETKHGPLPFTVQQRTGSGGRHLLFKMPDADIRPKVRLMAGLDVRANDSYIVVAPSMHICGNRYEWIVEPFHNKIADPPEWLINFVLTGKDEEPTLKKGEFETYTSQKINDGPKHTDDEWAEMVTSLLEGQRNSTLYTYYYHLLGHGIGPKEAAAILFALNKTYGTPPLDNKELERLMKSALKTHPRISGEVERYE